MKKIRILLSLLILSFLFTSCNKNNDPSFNSDDKSIEEDVNIKYIGTEKPYENTDKKESFERKYGKGRKDDSIKLEKAQGNLVSLKIGDIDLGISLLPSIVNPGRYSIFLNYENKNNDLGLEEENIEVGPIFEDENTYSLIAFYKVESSSGENLIVSQVQISDDFQYSKYSIFNKYMNRMDYAYFYNSNENINPTSIRSDSILNQAESIEKGDIKKATYMRVVEEDKYLKDLFRTYDIENSEKKADIDNSHIIVANFPKESDKLVRLLSIEKLKNGKFAIK